LVLGTVAAALAQQALALAPAPAYPRNPGPRVLNNPSNERNQCRKN
jgi:hypothetical protein